MKKKVASPPPLCQLEFDALPHSIQRKFFSSLERLQIQQQHHHHHQHHSQHEPSSGRSSSASSTAPLRPSLNLARRRVPKPDVLSQTQDVTQAQVDFFLSLPEKLRKQHFTRQEQQLLVAKCQQAQQPLRDFRFDFASTSTNTPPPTRCHTASSSAPSLLSQARPSLRLQTTVDTGINRQSSLYYLDLMTTSPVAAQLSSSTSHRRTMSFNALRVRHPSSPAVLTTDTPMRTTDAPMRTSSTIPQHTRTQSLSLSSRRSSETPTPSFFDSEATHYRDPEARKKLRTYLACPQKFDEAIEFGFPSTATDESIAPHFHLPQVDFHSRKFSQDMQTFLKNGHLSFFEDFSGNQDLESDVDSVPDADSPTTPSSMEPPLRVSHSRQVWQPKLSMDSFGFPCETGLAGREMTLRMTLTRPDLRADEEQLYGWQSSTTTIKSVKDDPFALADLVLSDDMTGTKGAFYVKPKARSNLVTRLMKRTGLKD